jgi:hypothetical protein
MIRSETPLKPGVARLLRVPVAGHLRRAVGEAIPAGSELD